MICMQYAQHQRTTYNNLSVLVPRACVSHNTSAQHTTICSLSCPAPVCHTAPTHNIQQFTRSRVPCLLRVTQHQYTTYNNFFRSRACCITSAQQTTICSLSCPSPACRAQHTTICSLSCPSHTFMSKSRRSKMPLDFGPNPGQKMKFFCFLDLNPGF